MSTVRESLKRALEQQVQLGIEAIYAGVFAGPDPASVSFRHLLSRVMVALQVPVTFVLFKRVDGKLVPQYRANKHPRHFGLITRQIRAASIDSLIPLFEHRLL